MLAGRWLTTLLLLVTCMFVGSTHVVYFVGSPMPANRSHMTTVVKPAKGGKPLASRRNLGPRSSKRKHLRSNSTIKVLLAFYWTKNLAWVTFKPLKDSSKNMFSECNISRIKINTQVYNPIKENVIKSTQQHRNAFFHISHCNQKSLCEMLFRSMPHVKGHMGTGPKHPPNCFKCLSFFLVRQAGHILSADIYNHPVG